MFTIRVAVVVVVPEAVQCADQSAFLVASLAAAGGVAADQSDDAVAVAVAAASKCAVGAFAAVVAIAVDATDAAILVAVVALAASPSQAVAAAVEQRRASQRAVLPRHHPPPARRRAMTTRATADSVAWCHQTAQVSVVAPSLLALTRAPRRAVVQWRHRRCWW